MTTQAFRRLALSMPEACEGNHMGHPDFRVNGKIFATLCYPDENWGMVKLTPEQQKVFVGHEPEVFMPVKGAWGRKGATNVHLRSVKVRSLRAALTAAWQNVSQNRKC
jgi:hypothetical protein